MIRIAETCQCAYDEQYTDAMTEWREVCGKYRADNILHVCKGQTLCKVLECGAGEGSILKYLDASNMISELFAVEVSDSGIAQINKRNIQKLVEVKKFNGFEIPYADKTFDMAYCSHAIGHVEHPRVLLRDLQRVCRCQVFEVPLDYSPQVDKRVRDYLSYGHVNIFTPSLFKFMLKSEGYEIIAERFTYAPEEVIRFRRYKGMKLKRTFLRESRLKLYPLGKAIKRIVYGKKWTEEYGYCVYTCLAKGTHALKIF